LAPFAGFFSASAYRGKREREGGSGKRGEGREEREKRRGRLD